MAKTRKSSGGSKKGYSLQYAGPRYSKSFTKKMKKTNTRKRYQASTMGRKVPDTHKVNFQFIEEVRTGNVRPNPSADPAVTTPGVTQAIRAYHFGIHRGATDKSFGNDTAVNQIHPRLYNFLKMYQEYRILAISCTWQPTITSDAGGVCAFGYTKNPTEWKVDSYAEAMNLPISTGGNLTKPRTFRWVPEDTDDWKFKTVSNPNGEAGGIENLSHWTAESMGTLALYCEAVSSGSYTEPAAGNALLGHLRWTIDAEFRDLTGHDRTTITNR